MRDAVDFQANRAEKYVIKNAGMHFDQLGRTVQIQLPTST